MDFNLLADTEARSPALSLSDSGTPQHEHSCKGQDHSGECKAQDTRKILAHPGACIWVASGLQCSQRDSFPLYWELEKWHSSVAVPTGRGKT